MDPTISFISAGLAEGGIQGALGSDLQHHGPGGHPTYPPAGPLSRADVMIGPSDFDHWVGVSHSGQASGLRGGQRGSDLHWEM